MIIQNWDAAQTRSIYIKPKAKMRTNRDICAEIKAYSGSIASVGSKLEYMHHNSSCHTACVHFDGHALIQVKSSRPRRKDKMWQETNAKQRNDETARKTSPALTISQ